MTTVTIPAGAISAPLYVPPGAIVEVNPASGASAFVEYTVSDGPAVANNVATWSSWRKGTVSAKAQDLLNDPAYIRVTATAGAVTLSINESPSALDLAQYTIDWGGGDSIPLERAATFASITNTTTARLVSVAADETNNGDWTLYFHNGSTLNWIPTQGV